MEIDWKITKNQIWLKNLFLQGISDSIGKFTPFASYAKKKVN